MTMNPDPINQKIGLLCRIAGRVCDVDPVDITGKRRTWRVVRARFMVYMVLYYDTCLSFEEIARGLNRDPSTVSCGFHAAKAAAETDRDFAFDLATVRREFASARYKSSLNKSWLEKMTGPVAAVVPVRHRRRAVRLENDEVRARAFDLLVAGGFVDRSKASQALAVARTLTPSTRKGIRA